MLIPYDPPFDWPATLSFFRYRAVEGMDLVSDASYARAIAGGRFEVSHDLSRQALRVTLSGPAPADAELRLRRMFGLDADIAAMASHLSQDPWLAELIARRPALRMPGWWDGFETAIRAVLGQQVSVVAARLLVRRLIDRCGSGAVFPTPEQVIDADLSAMGMPGARAATLKEVARAALSDPLLFERCPTVEETVAKLRAIKGIGDWSAHYIAIRACREPDAFPASDVGLLRGAAVDGVRPTASELLARAEAWRPYRAYAAHLIWAEDAAGWG